MSSSGGPSSSPAGSGSSGSANTNKHPLRKRDRFSKGIKNLLSQKKRGNTPVPNLPAAPAAPAGNAVLGASLAVVTRAPSTSSQTTNAPTVGVPAPGQATGRASSPGPAPAGNPATGNTAIVAPASPSSSASPWEMALLKLSPEDQQALNIGHLDKLGILDDVLKATKEKRDICRRKQWKFTWNQEEIIIRDVADKLLAWVDRFKSIGDTISSFDPVHAALPWAGFRFLLQIAVDDGQKMGVLLVGLEAIANLMGRCAIYETLYLGTGTRSAIKFEQAIVELYACILQYLVRAKQYFAQNTAVRIVSSVFDTSQETLLGDITKKEDVVLKTKSLADAEYTRSANKKLGDQISDEAGALNQKIIEKSDELKMLLQMFSKPIPRMESDLKALRDGLTDAVRTDILKWISEVEYERHHLNACEGRIDGTGEWLFGKDIFLRWQKSSASTILWLRGIPGAGKTKLTSRVIDKLLEQREKSSNDEALAYFYCKRDETGSTDPEAVMSAIVKQLSHLGAGSPLQKKVVSVYEARKLSGFSSKSLRFQESVDLIISLVNIYPQTTIVIDALDECDPQKRNKFLASLRTIVNSSTSLVKIFVSSRDDSDIVLRLDGLPNLWIEAKDNAGDIERFVRKEVTRCIDERELLFGNVTKELRGKIITSLIRGSQGMFLWADLQIKEVCSMDMAFDIEARLGKLPRTLNDTYIEILQRILSQRGSSPEFAKCALMWVMCSFEPFSPERLAAMISESHGYTTGSGLDAGSLGKICHNLLVIDRQNNVVRFAHLSVREFLEDNCFSTIDAHSMAAKSCLSYLIDGKDLMRSYRPGNDPVDHKLSVLQYQVYYWPIHVQRCLDQQEDLGLVELLITFLKSSTIDWRRACEYAGKNQMYWDDFMNIGKLDFERLAPLHIASAFGFGKKIKDLWDSESWDVNSTNTTGETALHFACRRGDLWIATTLLEKGANAKARGLLLAAVETVGNEKVVELLLEKGADANAQGGAYGNALQAAASASGNEKIVELLLEKGADVNAQGGYFGNALQAAARKTVNYKVVKLLLEKGANVNAQGGSCGNALQAAAEVVGNEKVVRLLLEEGADVNVLGGEYGYALQAAVSTAGNEKLVRLLLAKGADVNARGGYYGNALQAATRVAGNNKVVELLLAKGADVNAQGGHYGNTLQAAVSTSGNEKIVELLLEKGADVNAQGGHYGNALQSAVRIAGNEKIVELLLEKVVDINIQGGRYGNALQAAVSTPGNEKIVELLLKKGADINAQSDRHVSVLLTAVQTTGNEKVVELLLEKGADANAQGGRYGNVLQAALNATGDVKVVELLLEKGANVNAQGGWFGNALQTAANKSKDEKMVKLLLEKGADVNAQGGYFGNALQAAACRNRAEEIVKVLLKAGANVNAQGGHFGSALQAAAIKARGEKVVELLLENGADVNAQGGDNGNALQAATSTIGNRKTVELLLEKGADINAQGGFFGGALQAAVHTAGNDKVVELLLEQGAHVNAQGGWFGNALQSAVSTAGNERIVELLLEEGADVNAQGGEHGNALQAAENIIGNQKVVKLLLEMGVKRE